MRIRIEIKTVCDLKKEHNNINLKTMKTLKLLFCHAAYYFMWLGIFPQLFLSQNAMSATGEAKPIDSRPSQSDAASTQLISNYLAVTGGRQAHLKLRNVVATGTIKVSTSLRNFRLIETYDGKRHLTYYWTHLARKYREVFVHDGLQSWSQVLEPKKQEAKIYGGADGIHFAHQRWLVQPFTLPLLADYVFKYQGTHKVNGRPAYIIKGYGKQDVPSWFYFDQEKSLLTRWGGEGQIARVKEHMDYRARQFKSTEGVLLPSKIDLLAEDAAFGLLKFEQIQINQDLSDVSFFMPRSTIPTLHQRPVAPN
jgi:hypothetical protein